MSVFQSLTLGTLAILVVWDIVQLATGRGARRPAFVRCLIWTTAAVSIARPQWIQMLANRIGIQRGADLVMYSMALTFLATTFFLYARTVQLQRQVIELARELAILKAVRPAAAGNADDGPAPG